MNFDNCLRAITIQNAGLCKSVTLYAESYTVGIPTAATPEFLLAVLGLADEDSSMLSTLSIVALAAAAAAFFDCANKEYDQCGGQGWTGATCCPPYDQCTVINPYYSQCQPKDFCKVSRATAPPAAALRGRV